MIFLWGFGIFVLIMIFFTAVLYALRSEKSTSRTIELHYRQKDTYCDVWSPQLPGASSVAATKGPALIQYLQLHGEKLGIRFKEVT